MTEVILLPTHKNYHRKEGGHVCPAWCRAYTHIKSIATMADLVSRHKVFVIVIIPKGISFGVIID